MSIFYDSTPMTHSDAVKRGMERARARGVHVGRPRRVLLPAAERRAVVDLWLANGKPGGMAGLGVMLGGCRPKLAEDLFRAYRRFGSAWAGMQLR